MVCIGLLFKWVNVLIILGYALYYCSLTVIPSLQAHLKNRAKKRAEHVACSESFKQQRLSVDASTKHQKIIIEQLTAKMAQWHAYEIEAKKKLQSLHSKIYHDTKRRIEQQTEFLTQHTLLLHTTDALINAVQKQLRATIDKKEHNNYNNAIISSLKKDTHGL